MSAGIALLSQKNKVQELVCKTLDMESVHLQSVEGPGLLGWVAERESSIPLPSPGDRICRSLQIALSFPMPSHSTSGLEAAI